MLLLKALAILLAISTVFTLGFVFGALLSEADR